MMPADIRRLGANDLDTMHGMLTMFGEVFDEPQTYDEARPGNEYLRQLLDTETFVALAALDEAQVVGGLVAYELPKFEQRRSEFYAYDLAVSAEHRRRGIATALIEELRGIAAGRGAHVIYIQADHGDAPAIALYTKLGTREDIAHFDIPVD